MADGETFKPVRVVARGRDATLTCEALTRAGIACEPDLSFTESLEHLDKIHLLVVAEELLEPHYAGALVAHLAAQPPWSDLPILVVARQNGPTGRALGALEEFGNVSVLERPLKMDELITAVRSGLRARRRQFEVRDLLHEREEADRRKDEFLAMLAHELRNPLAPIRGVASLMRARDVADPDLVEARDILDRQVTHMARLVDDLLDVSRITRGVIELKSRRFDLVDLARKTIRAAVPGIEARGLRLVSQFPERPVYVDADPIRIEQVVANLLSNAAKYTDAGGEIRLRIDHTPAHATVQVEDDGIGIDPLVLPRVFDVFSQEDRSLDRTRGGLGLGLTIVKRLMELHGGSVEVRSEGVGKGTQVRVQLPRSTSPLGQKDDLEPEVHHNGHAAKPNGSALRILIVEDNRDAADLLARLLRHDGYDLRVAYDGIAGLKAAREFRPQVVISDIGLPGMDGHQLARELRSDPKLAGLTLVAVSGYGDVETVAGSRRAGFDHHYVKPVDLERLDPILQQAASVPAH